MFLKTLDGFNNNDFLLLIGNEFVNLNMGTQEIIREIEKLPIRKRMVIIERTLRSIRQKGQKKQKTQMEKAVNVLLQDYKNDKELTAFTALDMEAFHETK